MDQLLTVSQKFWEAMEHAARLRVELVVECGVGENWLEAH